MDKNISPIDGKKTLSYQQAYKIYKYIAQALIAATCALGILLFIFSAEDHSNYLSSSPLLITFYILLALDTAFTVCSCFYFRKAGNVVCSSRISRLLNILPAVAAFLCIVAEFSNAEKSVLDVLIIISAALTVVYCISRMINSSMILLMMSGIGQAAFGILAVVKIYIISYVEVNAPAKTLLLFAAIFSVISHVASLRQAIDQGSATGFFFPILFSVSIPIIALAATAVLPSISTGPNTVFLFYSIFFTACAVRELVSLPFTAISARDNKAEVNTCHTEQKGNDPQ